MCDGVTCHPDRRPLHRNWHFRLVASISLSSWTHPGLGLHLSCSCLSCLVPPHFPKLVPTALLLFSHILHAAIWLTGHLPGANSGIVSPWLSGSETWKSWITAATLGLQATRTGGIPGSCRACKALALVISRDKAKWQMTGGGGSFQHLALAPQDNSYAF